MTILSTSSRPSVPAIATPRSDLGVPVWVEELLARCGAKMSVESTPTTNLRVLESSAFSLVTVRCENATQLNPDAFETRTRDAYAAIARRLQNCDVARYPVRFWNYIPEIHRPCGEGLDRYMCFNAGRFAACSDWLGGPDTFDRLLATGSGVGHAGPDLVVHALAAAAPGIAVENPRQIPAYRYSRRFGPRPPCFARATLIRENGQPYRILVGGTASIRGEESVHVGDLTSQMLETFENLASLVRSAGGGSDANSALSAFREIRVYHFHESDRSAVEKLVERAFPSLDRVEYRRADLCRPELSVEIEGVAEIRSTV